MRLDKLTTKFQQALADAQSLANGHDNQMIEPQHLLLALLQQEDGGTSSLLAQAGAQGFPTVLLEDGRGHMRVLELSHYLGRPQQWLSYLRAELARQASATE